MKIPRALLVAAAMMELEARRLRHEHTEVVTRAVQPLLWLLVFGPIMANTRAIPTGGVPYMEFLTPGVVVQSVTFVSIFYGLNIVWEGESGILKRLLSLPIPRFSIVVGRASAAFIRALVQFVVVSTVAAAAGVRLSIDAASLAVSVASIYLLSLGLASLSIFIAAFMKTRERFMGIGQAITMPLWFSSNAIYPTAVMPDVFKIVALANPLTYGVDALRKVLIFHSFDAWLDLAALGVFAAATATLASLNFRRVIQQ
ncbi:MAG: ABC transporter permease [Pyrobaculum sp.]|uniref:ABC transporter permease n=1 Tax=Pyrobaculum sp. TaxID=2004705 RepID=UPI003168B9CF